MENDFSHTILWGRTEKEKKRTLTYSHQNLNNPNLFISSIVTNSSKLFCNLVTNSSKLFCNQSNTTRTTSGASERCLCYKIFSFMGNLLQIVAWPLCCLSFDLRIWITPLVSSKSSCQKINDLVVYTRCRTNKISRKGAPTSTKLTICNSIMCMRSYTCITQSTFQKLYNYQYINQTCLTGYPTRYTIYLTTNTAARQIWGKTKSSQTNLQYLHEHWLGTGKISV